MRESGWGLVLSALWALDASPAAALEPAGAEFQVNSYTISNQTRPEAAMDADGDFVVAWPSSGQDGSLFGVFAQRFAASGQRQAAEFQVNAYTTASQNRPAIASEANGDFVVTWDSNGQDGNGYGVFARRFTSSGGGSGGEFQVNTYTSGLQGSIVVAMDGDGDFVIAWDSVHDGEIVGIFARRFSSAGAPQGQELQINALTTGAQQHADVAMDAGGNFVVVWEDLGRDGGDSGVFGRRFDAAGAPLSGDFQVNLHTLVGQRNPAVAGDDDGDFVVAWESLAQDGFNYGIFARRFSSSGAAQGGEFQVNVTTADDQRYPSIRRTAAAGDFVVTWRSDLQDGSGEGIFGRTFGGFGAPVGAEFQVNSYTIGNQARPEIAMDADGDLVVVWESAVQDGDQGGVFAQRSSIPSGPTPTPTSTPTPKPPPEPVTGQFQINAYTPDVQTFPAAAMDADGDFVIAWRGDDLLGDSGSDIFARRFDRTGAPQGTDLQISTATAQALGGHAVAMRPDGGFVVVWTDDFGTDGFGRGVFARRFSSIGASEGGPFQVNSHTTQNQLRPSISMRDDGAFAVVWDSGYQDGSGRGVFGRRFDPSGIGQAAEFQVNALTTLDQDYGAVAMQGGGDFVVIWRGQDQDGYGIRGRRFNAAGSPQAAEFAVNTTFTGRQLEPAVAIADDGRFVVAWTSDAQDGAGYGVFGRRFDGANAAQGGELQIASFTTSAQRRPAVAMDGGAGFVVTWESQQDGYNYGVFARSFDASGARVGVELQVNVRTQGIERLPAIAMDGQGDFVVAWAAYVGDGSNYGIFARLFSGGAEPPLDVDGDGAFGALTDGLLILRYLFEFTGASLITGAVGPGCTRCTAPQIEAHLDSIASLLDADGNAVLGALTDGLLILRYLFEFTGASLTTGALGQGCTRCTATAIIEYLDPLAN
jgi:hypothetical protein